MVELKSSGGPWPATRSTTKTRGRSARLSSSRTTPTIDWIEKYLQTALGKEETLSLFAGCVASVSGVDSRNELSRAQAVYGFAPVSTDAPPGTKDQFDLLLCTDVLAEGMNL